MFVFHFLGKGVGGVPVLLVRLTEALDKAGEKVKVIAPADSFIITELQKKNVQFHHIDTNDLSADLRTKIDNDDILICSHFDTYLYPLKFKNPRLIFYNIMTDFASLINEYKFGLNFKSLTRKLVNKMERSNALYFMDSAGVKNLKKDINVSLVDPKYIPIPVDALAENLFLKRIDGSTDKIKISYVGRSEVWKIMPIKKVLSDIIKLNYFDKINFEINIVCDEKEKYITHLDQLIKVLPPNISLNFFENIKHEELAEFLLNNSHLHFAMGTSALEGAKAGIPSIITDASYNDIGENYKYKWLYQTEDYTLGDFIMDDYEYEGLTMQQILDLYISSPGKVKDISQQCYQYVRSSHSIDEIVTKLISAANSSQLRFKDCTGSVIYYSLFHRVLKRISNSD